MLWCMVKLNNGHLNNLIKGYMHFVGGHFILYHLCEQIQSHHIRQCTKTVMSFLNSSVSRSWHVINTSYIFSIAPEINICVCLAMEIKLPTYFNKLIFYLFDNPNVTTASY